MLQDTKTRRAKDIKTIQGTMSSQTKHTQKEWVLLFQRGEEKAYDYFFRLHYKTLCFFANRYVKNRAIAEDIAQEAFIKLWEMREKIKAAAPVKSLLYTIVKNEAISWLRKQKTVLKRQKQFNALRTDETETCMLQHMIASETLHELYKAAEALPPACRKIFDGLYKEGKTVREIAAGMQLSVNTIKTQRARGLTIIRKNI